MPKGTINGLKVDIPKELFDQDGKATVVVSSVNLDDRYAVIKFLDANVVCFCYLSKPALYSERVTVLPT